MLGAQNQAARGHSLTSYVYVHRDLYSVQVEDYVKQSMENNIEIGDRNLSHHYPYGDGDCIYLQLRQLSNVFQINNNNNKINNKIMKDW
jgi:hypothetical protein